ncbi:hypothetical protein CkaCkLH20_07393 [Colletotrichum karsti]|uniref:Uncharacterized protein n=1 Tax=Colletotrichum karsti TaxID=1095194 RepID=A0A9P6I199_9PEZI|nr:uncharacterized protein CkaCkLH20_07393 [Colletotrichum karsti]KAF9875127.1 hypothetical protein CkaCkLH20_07393 [Colletotrichum karsti]
MSTYAIDGGLWTACKESRAAMYRRYDPVRWASFYSRQREKGRPDHESRISRYDSDKYSQMPATFVVEDDREGLRNFTVLPIYDLIFIQPWRVSPHLAYLDLDMPFSCPQYGFGGVRHLALDFDPTWSTDELQTYQKTWEDPEVDAELDPARWGIYNALVEAMQATLRLSDTTIWLVDPRLYRKSTVLTEKDSKEVFGVGRSWEKEQLVFHASDCRYYAMPDQATSELCGYGDETLDTVWNFIYELQDIAARQYALDERVPEDEVNEVWTELGVLVREKQMMEQTA